MRQRLEAHVRTRASCAASVRGSQRAVSPCLLSQWRTFYKGGSASADTLSVGLHQPGGIRRRDLVYVL